MITACNLQVVHLMYSEYELIVEVTVPCVSLFAILF